MPIVDYKHRFFSFEIIASITPLNHTSLLCGMSSIFNAFHEMHLKAYADIAHIFLQNISFLRNYPLYEILVS